MRSLIYILFASCFFVNGFSQIIPYGLSLSIEGKVEIVTGKPANFPFQIENPVYMVCENGDSSVEDVSWFKDQHLTILDVPDPNWTNYSIQVEDVPPAPPAGDFPWYLLPIWDSSIAVTVFWDSSILTAKEDVLLNDIVDYHGTLPEPGVRSVRERVEKYIRSHRGRDLDNDAWDELYEEISAVDTVMEKEYVYDYLVSKLVLYDYEGGKLTHALGYFFRSAGVETDTLRYDQRGNLVYFHRETIGIGGEQIWFTCNPAGQVTYFRQVHYYLDNSSYRNCPSCCTESVFEQKFGYDEAGNLNYLASRYPASDYYDGLWYGCRIRIGNP
ncbi:MAG: hypothetical protein H6581_22855 [Bacteroidia bacterium]|nr:hypothetical protein [Bacteroidia bacterium]